MKAVDIVKNKALGDMTEGELLILLEYWTDEYIEFESDKKKVKEATELAIVLHRNQKRKSRNGLENTPYIEHVLRNTLRLFRWGVEDHEVIIASLLHDVVEDCSIQFLEDAYHKEGVAEAFARERLEAYIECTFSPNIAWIVSCVTNPLTTKDGAKVATLPKEERQKLYRDRVAEVIINAQVFQVKVSDFIDNAGGLYHSEDSAFKVSQARKYAPLVDKFIKTLESHQVRKSIVPSIAEDIMFSLSSTKYQLDEILETAPSSYQRPPVTFSSATAPMGALPRQ